MITKLFSALIVYEWYTAVAGSLQDGPQISSPLVLHGFVESLLE